MSDISVGLLVGDAECETPAHCGAIDCWGCLACPDYEKDRSLWCDHCRGERAADDIDAAEPE